MQNTNIITTEQTPNTISASNTIFNVQALTQLQAVAGLMSQATVTVPDHLRGNPADCMAIIMQAMQWGMNPYAVAQKTHLVNGVLGYEAQLVNAVISSSSAIVGRFHYKYEGDWEKCSRTRVETVKKTAKGGGIYEKKETIPCWTSEDEYGLSVRVGAVLRGESEITWGEPVFLSSVITRNSPLWTSNPKQQLAYLALKYWARLYCPDVILGVYTRDELDEPQEKIINPVQEHKNTSACRAERETTIIEQDAGENWISAFRERIEQAQSTGETTALRQEVEDHKNTLGALYTELKGKVVQRHHRLNAIARIEKMINDLPSSGDPEAEQKFTALENTLNAARPHLGELYEAYKTTLTDMKPEYIGS
ncbi:recombinase RecT [Escherichia coli]|nr:recombinase RecT [Escherichia coli]